MTKALFTQAMAKFTLGVVLIGALLFLPAGTWNYPGARRLMVILFSPMFLAGLVMMWKNPELLKKRLQAKEKELKRNPSCSHCGLILPASRLEKVNFCCLCHIICGISLRLP